MSSDTLETKLWKTRRKRAISIWDPRIIRSAIPASFKKLDPHVQVKNPVMFVVEIGTAMRNIAKKWTMPIRDWKTSLNRLAVEFVELFSNDQRLFPQYS